MSDPKKIRLIVVCEGGLVRSVFSDHADFEFDLLDHDACETDSFDEESIRDAGEEAERRDQLLAEIKDSKLHEVY